MPTWISQDGLQSRPQKIGSLGVTIAWPGIKQLQKFNLIAPSKAQRVGGEGCPWLKDDQDAKGCEPPHYKLVAVVFLWSPYKNNNDSSEQLSQVKQLCTKSPLAPDILHYDPGGLFFFFFWIRRKLQLCHHLGRFVFFVKLPSRSFSLSLRNTAENILELSGCYSVFISWQKWADSSLLWLEVACDRTPLISEMLYLISSCLFCFRVRLMFLGDNCQWLSVNNVL